MIQPQRLTEQGGMPISTEIEKLERRWQQTAGLVFAPLAEAYRKAGLQARALELLNEGLALHPDYGPALIVRGRCHLDMGNLPEAETAFQQALVLDPMDPIALRGIADVFARTSRVAKAIERLNLLVEIDPRNLEARQTLERLLREPIPPAPNGPSERSEPSAPETPSEEAPGEATETAPPPVTVAAPAALPEPVHQPLPVPQLAPAEEPEPEPAVAAAPAHEPMPDIPPASEPPPDAAGPEAALLDLPIEVVNLSGDDDMPVASEGLTAGRTGDELKVESFAVEPFEVPSMQQPDTEPPRPEPVQPISWTPAVMESSTPEPEETAEVPPPVPEPAPEPEPEPAPEPEPPVTWVAASPEVLEYAFPMSAAVEPPLNSVSAPEGIEPEPGVFVPADGPVAEVVEDQSAPPTPAAEASPELIVTESMAELFLKQGHRELALAVYRQLAQRSPDLDRLQQAIERIEDELGQRPSSANRRNYAASATGGRSVEALLRSVLRAHPPEAGSSVLPPAIEPAAGEPARAGGDALALSVVFGDEPVVPPRAEPSPPEAPEPSYDEFFGAPGKEAGAAGGSERNPESEDLRQFNEWLKGLKR